MRGKGYALLIMLRATFIRCNAHPYVNFPFRVDDYISHSSRSIPRPLDIPYAPHELTLREFFLTPARSIWFRHCIFVSCNIVSNSSRSLCTRLDSSRLLFILQSSRLLSLLTILPKSYTQKWKKLGNGRRDLCAVLRQSHKELRIWVLSAHRRQTILRQ